MFDSLCGAYFNTGTALSAFVYIHGHRKLFLDYIYLCRADVNALAASIAFIRVYNYCNHANPKALFTRNPYINLCIKDSVKFGR